jgi:hypothetical protein
MDLFLGGIDVLDQTIDTPFIIPEELERIPGEWLEHTKSLGLFGNDLELSWKIGLGNYLSANLGLSLLDLFGGLLLQLTPESRNSDSPDQRIDGKAGPWEQENEEQPGASGRGAPPLWNIKQHGQPDNPLTD